MPDNILVWKFFHGRWKQRPRDIKRMFLLLSGLSTGSISEAVFPEQINKGVIRLSKLGVFAFAEIVTD